MVDENLEWCILISTTEQSITFRSAAEVLETFGMQQGGSQYRRHVCALQRIFGATIYFETEMQSQRAQVTHQARFNFLGEAPSVLARSEPGTLAGWLRE